MARALYNKLNKYNLGGLVKRYEHGGQHAEDGSPIYSGDTFVEAEGDTGSNIYTTKRNNPYAYAEGEKEANEATRKELQDVLTNIWRDDNNPVKQALDKAREDGTSSNVEYNRLNAKRQGAARNNPLKTMATLSELGFLNLEDYPSFNKRLDFLTPGWGDQTKADFLKGIASGVIEEGESTRGGKQVSEDSFIQSMYKGGDPSKGFKRSLTDPKGNLKLKERDTPLAGGLQTRGRLGVSNKVIFDPSQTYTYTEGVKDEEVIEDEKIVEDDQIVDDQTVVEEKVDMEEVTTKDPVKTPTVVKKDIVPVEEKDVVEDKGEVVEEEIPVLTGDQPGPPPPMKFDIQGRSDRTGTGGPGGSSDVPTQADTGLYGITAPRQNFRLLKEGETREGGGKLYRHGGLAMLARRSRQAAMGMKYNSAKHGRKYNQGGRMTNQELGRLLAKYNVR